jgi:hypothetical protein
VPEYLCETTRDQELPPKFVKYRGVTIRLNKSGRRLTPLFIGPPNKLKKHHFQIVAVTLRVAEPKVMARVEVNQNCSAGNRVIDNVVEMQIAVRPCLLVMAAGNLVDSLQLAGCRDERVDARFLPMKQLPQTDTANFRNDHRRARTYFDGRPLRIQQPGTMDLPIHPLLGSDKHADSAPRQRQESIPEPDDNTSARSASLYEYWYAIVHAFLNLIHTNTIHEPGNDSLQFVNHRLQPNVFVTGGACRKHEQNRGAQA